MIKYICGKRLLYVALNTVAYTNKFYERNCIYCAHLLTMVIDMKTVKKITYGTIIQHYYPIFYL